MRAVEKPFPFAMLCWVIILKAINSFFQDRKHKPLLRFEAYIAPTRKILL